MRGDALPADYNSADYFLLCHAQRGIMAEFPVDGVGMLVKSGPEEPIRRVWADGEAYERFSFKTGDRLSKDAEQAESVEARVRPQAARLHVSLKPRPAAGRCHSARRVLLCLLAHSAK